jgi:uncharacterized protein YjiS (DUF1127 family)
MQMTRINSARLRKLEQHRARLRDLRQMSDEQLNRAIADELGISPEEVEAMSDEDLDRLIAEAQEAEQRQ